MNSIPEISSKFTPSEAMLFRMSLHGLREGCQENESGAGCTDGLIETLAIFIIKSRKIGYQPPASPLGSLAVCMKLLKSSSPVAKKTSG